MLLSRANKGLLNRAQIWSMQLRGTAMRLCMPTVLAGARGLLVGRNVEMTVYGDLIVGARVILAAGCTIEVGPRGRLVIGDDVFIGRYSVIRAHELIEIAERCNIAEHCTIRDQDHQINPDLRLGETDAVSAPVRLERNVWVGAGARLLRGARVGEGSVVAANAVVRGEFPARTIIGGVPARILRTVEGEK
jgi:serine acetyltransferase